MTHTNPAAVVIRTGLAVQNLGTTPYQLSVTAQSAVLDNPPINDPSDPEADLPRGAQVDATIKATAREPFDPSRQIKLTPWAIFWVPDAP